MQSNHTLHTGCMCVVDVITSQAKAEPLHNSTSAPALPAAVGEQSKDWRTQLQEARAPSYLWTNFPRLKTRKMFSKGNMNRQKQMFVWQRKPLHASLTRLPIPLWHPALHIHKNILGFCGDRDHLYPETLCDDIVRKGLKGWPKLGDEIYVQLMKHISNNPTGSSSKAAWNLMCICANAFPPNKFLQPYLINFLSTPIGGDGMVEHGDAIRVVVLERIREFVEEKRKVPLANSGSKKDKEIRAQVAITAIRAANDQIKIAV